MLAGNDICVAFKKDKRTMIWYHFPGQQFESTSCWWMWGKEEIRSGMTSTWNTSSLGVSRGLSTIGPQILRRLRCYHQSDMYLNYLLKKTLESYFYIFKRFIKYFKELYYLMSKYSSLIFLRYFHWKLHLLFLKGQICIWLSEQVVEKIIWCTEVG